MKLLSAFLLSGLLIFSANAKDLEHCDLLRYVKITETSEDFVISYNYEYNRTHFYLVKTNKPLVDSFLKALDNRYLPSLCITYSSDDCATVKGFRFSRR